MGRPRVADEDRLISEDLLEGSLVGEWVRCALYAEGHRVSRVGHTAVCGRPLVVDEYWFERFQLLLTEWSGYRQRTKGAGRWSPSEWYLALDRRANASRCAACKKPDLMEETSPISDTSRCCEVFPSSEVFPLLTTADRISYVRLLSQVANVARELNAEII